MMQTQQTPQIPAPTVLVIILNYRTPEMTVKAAKAALREMQGIEGELVIVDNDSGDGSFEQISLAMETLGNTQKTPVRVLQSGHNGGFGAGNNVGIRAGLSDGRAPDYYYILNSDAFPDAGAIRHLIAALDQNPSAGFAGSYIHGPEGEAHITAFRFPSISSEFEGAARFGPISRLLKNAVVPLPLPETTQLVDWLAGASLMMRRQVLDRIGLFDEVFFLYFEETDLCLRASRAGWQTLYVRESAVAHIGSVSTGMKTWSRIPGYWLQSRQHYYRKNHGPAYAATATLALLAGGLLWQARRLIQGKPQQDPPHYLRDVAHQALFGLTRRRPKPKSAKPAQSQALTPVSLPSSSIRRDT